MKGRSRYLLYFLKGFLWVGVFVFLLNFGVEIISRSNAKHLDKSGSEPPPLKFMVLALAERSKGIRSGNVRLLGFGGIDAFKQQNPDCTFAFEPINVDLRFGRVEVRSFLVDHLTSNRRRMKLILNDDDITYFCHYEVENEVVYPVYFRMIYFGYVSQALPYVFGLTIIFYLITEAVLFLIKKRGGGG